MEDPPTVYIVAGEEPLFVQQSLDRIRRQLRQQGYTREVLEIEPSFDWAELAQATATRSLFSSKQLFELRISTLKAYQSGTAALQLQADRADPDCVILVWIQELGMPPTKSFPTTAQVHLHPTLRPHQFRTWLQQQAACTTEAIDFLQNAYAGNVLAAHQLFQKLALQATPAPYTLDAVAMLAEDVAQYTVFTGIDRVFAGETATIPRTLAVWEETGLAPLLVLGVLLKSVREWLCARDAMHHGADIATALRTANVWTRRLPCMQQALQRHPYTAGLQWLQAAATIESYCKQGDATLGWQHLTQLCLQISQESTCTLGS